MNRQVIILAKFTQSAALDNLIAISYRGIRDVFTDDDLKQPKSLAIQLAQQIQFIGADGDRKSTRLNSSHGYISYAVFCLKKQTVYILYSSGTTGLPQCLIHAAGGALMQRIHV